MIRNNKYSIFITLVIIYLSFANAKTFEGVDVFKIPYLDKIVHFALYFLLMLVIIIEHRRSLLNTRLLIFVAMIPVIFGSMIELMQSDLTTTRHGDILDIISNSAGVFCSVLLWLLVRPYKLEKIR